MTILEALTELSAIDLDGPGTGTPNLSSGRFANSKITAGLGTGKVTAEEEADDRTSRLGTSGLRFESDRTLIAMMNDALQTEGAEAFNRFQRRIKELDLQLREFGVCFHSHD
jgi:hypothetical protein